MSLLKRMLPYLTITVTGYLLLPLYKMGSGIFLIPIPVFVCGVVYGIRNTFHWSYTVYAIIVAALFIPIIFIFLNETAYIYPLIMGVIALAGILIGRLLSVRAP